MVLHSYMGQLYLRKHLNQIHSVVYSEKASNTANLMSTLNAVSDAQWRVQGMLWVPPAFQFKEEDPPAKDILSARLRAKYWGAQVITYRPCIKLILDLSFRLRAEEAEARNRPMAMTPGELSEATIREVRGLHKTIWEHAKRGIQALIESTQAFHGLGESRPIITNIFGTAHA